MLKNYNEDVKVETVTMFDFLTRQLDVSKKKETYEAIASVYNLHWMENPLKIIQMFSQLLSHDGVLLGCCFGENSIPELKFDNICI